MSAALVAAAVLVVAGSVVCLSAREARIATAGLAVTLLVAPFLADPLPSLLVLTARVVGALLATYLVWIVVRDPAASTRGTLLGWPFEALIAAAGFSIGLGTAGLGAEALGPPEAHAAGFALICLSVGPIVFGRDVFRLGSGAVLLVAGTLLVRVGLAGTPSALEELATAVLFAGLGGAIAFLVVHALETGTAAGAILDEPALGGNDRADAARIP